MDIKTIAGKIKGHLTEEEVKYLLKSIRKKPEFIIQELDNNSVINIVSDILNDTFALIKKYGKYDLFDKGIVYDEPKVLGHIETLHKLDLQEVQEIFVKLIESGCDELMVAELISSYDGVISDIKKEKLIDHNLLRDLWA